MNRLQSVINSKVLAITPFTPCTARLCRDPALSRGDLEGCRRRLATRVVTELNVWGFFLVIYDRLASEKVWHRFQEQISQTIQKSSDTWLRTHTHKHIHRFRPLGRTMTPNSWKKISILLQINDYFVTLQYVFFYAFNFWYAYCVFTYTN